MKIDEKFAVKIIDQETNGRGVAKVKDVVVFVTGALPNDNCNIVITNIKKNYAEADAVKIINESDERTVNDCPYYPLCGGCDLRHQKYEYQLLFKKGKVFDALERIGGFYNLEINDTVPSNPYNYRNKVTLKIKENHIGFYKNNSYEIIDIDKCLISNENINKYIPIIRDFINKYSNHNISEIMIRADKEVMINIISKDFKLKDEFINYFKDIDSITLNNKCIHGKDYINIKLLDYNYKISSNSFFQVNIEQTKSLYNKIIEYVKQENNPILLDLYCGVGTISCAVSKYCNKVIGIEVVEEAVINAKENVRINNINNIEFINNKVENVIDNIKDNVDIVVLDPPRSGSDNKTLNTIININPKTIIYVSCEPTTLARDLKILSDKYKVIEVTPFDMFPNTNHVECIVKLCRKKI